MNESTIAALKEAVEKSPLKMVTGTCRFEDLCIDDWSNGDGEQIFEEFIEQNKPVIKFVSADGTLFGDITVMPNMSDDYFDTTRESYTLHLCLNREDDGKNLNVFVKTKDGEFPYLQTFGDFVAMI